jgi:hypothetical protein
VARNSRYDVLACRTALYTTKPQRNLSKFLDVTVPFNRHSGYECGTADCASKLHTVYEIAAHNDPHRRKKETSQLNNLRRLSVHETKRENLA